MDLPTGCATRCISSMNRAESLFPCFSCFHKAEVFLILARTMRAYRLSLWGTIQTNMASRGLFLPSKKKIEKFAESIRNE